MLWNPKKELPEKEKCADRYAAYIKHLDFELKNYLVKSEQIAPDNRSVYCEISVNINLDSDALSYERKHVLHLKMYDKTENGERQFEYTVK